MKFRWNLLIQILGIVVQVLNQAQPLLEGHGPEAAIGTAITMGAVGVAAHWWNPDGTSAEEPFRG